MKEPAAASLPRAPSCVHFAKFLNLVPREKRDLDVAGCMVARPAVPGQG